MVAGLELFRDGESMYVTHMPINLCLPDSLLPFDDFITFSCFAEWFIVNS